MTTFVIHVWQTSIAFSLPYQLCFVLALGKPTSSSPFLIDPFSFPLSPRTDLSFFIPISFLIIGENTALHSPLSFMFGWFQSAVTFCSFSNFSVSPWNNDCVTSGVPKNNFFEISPLLLDSASFNFSLTSLSSPLLSFKLMILLVVYQGSTMYIEFVIWRIIYK